VVIGGDHLGVLQPDEFQQPAGEDEGVAGDQPVGKILLDLA
jgi:hypothetical protein